DFAVLVLTPDDLLVRQGEERNAARDNVLLELGLFMGRLGRSRTFAVCQKDSNLKLPSDLAGVSLASFSAPGGSGRLVAALGPACFKIRNAIRAYQKEAAVDQIQSHLHAQETQLAEQRKRIEEQQDVINKLVIFSMAAYLFDHLKALYHRQRKGGE